jgi:hypothetical protein
VDRVKQWPRGAPEAKREELAGHLPYAVLAAKGKIRVDRIGRWPPRGATGAVPEEVETFTWQGNRVISLASTSSTRRLTCVSTLTKKTKTGKRRAAKLPLECRCRVTTTKYKYTKKRVVGERRWRSTASGTNAFEPKPRCPFILLLPNEMLHGSML